MGPPEPGSAAGAVTTSSCSTPQLLSKTCQNCFHLKIRCVKNQQRDACDRCIRLNKQCVFRPARRRRNSAKRDVRIEALEAQVQQLLHGQGAATAAENQQNSQSQASSRPPPNQLVTESPTGVNLNAQSSATDSRTDGDVVDCGLVSLAFADRLLGVYKSVLTPQFPFVVVQPDTSVGQLRRSKPFLFLAIMTAALFDDMPTQRKLGEKVKKAISERIFSDSTLSLDMLQGLLIFLAWSQYHPRPRRYTQYMQLAISIVIDSRLDRKPVSLWKTRFGSSRDPPSAQKSLGSEEQRALLGCFYLSSSVSKLLHKLNPLPYTKYMEDCCLSLRERNEYPTDVYLYDLFRLQYVVERAEGLSTLQGKPNEARTLIGSLRSELGILRTQLASGLGGTSSLLLMGFYTAEAFLCQEAFFDQSLQLDTPLKLELLCAGLAAAKSFLDFYFSLPLGSEVSFNNTEWIQVSYVLTLASRFAIASTEKTADHYRARELRQSLDLSNVLQRLLSRIGSMVTSQIDDTGERDIFFHYQQRAKRIQTWFERSTAPAKAQPEQPTSYQPQIAAAQHSVPNFHAYSQSLDAFLTVNNQPIAGNNIPLEEIPTDAGMWQNMFQEGQYDFRNIDIFPEAAEDFMFSDWWPWMHP